MLPTTVLPLAFVPRLTVTFSRILLLSPQVLGNGTNDSTGEEDVAVAYACAVEHGDAIHQGIVVANDDILVNVAEGANLTVLTNNGLGMDVC